VKNFQARQDVDTSGAAHAVNGYEFFCNCSLRVMKGRRDLVKGPITMSSFQDRQVLF